MKELEGVVYKFYGFHDYVIRSLMANEIYFSDSSLFNDVYESSFGIEDISPHLHGTDQQRDQVSQSVAKFLFGIPSKARAFCASKKCDNSLMWAHYGSQHSGFCVAYSIDAISKGLQYRSPNSPNSVKLAEAVLSGSIDYEETPPVVSAESVIKYYRSKGTDGDALNEILSKIFFSKSKDWIYEDEYRFLIPESKKDGNFLVKLPSDAIIGIAFGVRAKEDDKIWLRSIFNKVKFYQAKSVDGKYNLDFDELT